MKIILYSITLSVIMLTAVFVITLTYSSEDALLMENVEALAQDQNDASLQEEEAIECWDTFYGHNALQQEHKTYCLDCKAHLCIEWFVKGTCKN